MTQLVINNIVRFVLLFAIQILILSNVTLFGCASPCLYLLFILMLPTKTNRMATLSLAFLMGLGIDIFCNMLGLNAFACTMMAFARILFGNRILTHGEKIDIDTPSIYSVSPQQFITYIVIMLLVFFFTFFSLELFEYGDIFRLLLDTLASTILTTLLILLTQILTIKKDK